MKESKENSIYEIDEKFYRLPKVLFTSDRYKDMSSLVKALYMILLDRRCLSEWSGLAEFLGNMIAKYAEKLILIFFQILMHICVIRK